MNAEIARATTDLARENEKASEAPRILASIQDLSAKGQSHATARTTRETRETLKSEGFRVYSILSITLIRW